MLLECDFMQDFKSDQWIRISSVKLENELYKNFLKYRTINANYLSFLTNASSIIYLWCFLSNSSSLEHLDQPELLLSMPSQILIRSSIRSLFSPSDSHLLVDKALKFYCKLISNDDVFQLYYNRIWTVNLFF